MAEIWGAAIAAGISVAGTAYAANQQKKAAAQANQSLGGMQQVNYKHLPFPQLVDPSKAQMTALGLNKRTLGENFGLASKVNRFQQGQAIQGYTAMQPWFRQLQDQIGRNALSFARGELPSDVIGSIGRASASRGLSSGFGLGASGGGAGTSLGALNLRALGLTSLDLSKTGTSLAMQANSQAQQLTPGLYDPTQNFVTPNSILGAMQSNASTINHWNELNAGYSNQQAEQNTSLANSVLQSQTQNQLQSGYNSANLYASAANTVAGLLKDQNQQKSGYGSFFPTSSAAQNNLSSYGGTPTYTPYGYAVRPALA